MKTKKLLFVLALVSLVTVLVLIFFVSQARVVILGRASSEQYKVENSYIFADPLLVKTTSEASRVTVYLLNDRSRGVKGRKIILFSNPSGLTFAEIKAETDSYGQAVFQATSIGPGQYEIGARVEGDNTPFPLTVTVRYE